MIKKSISAVLALAVGLIPAQGEKQASLSRNFSLSAPVFRQTDDGTTELVQNVGAIEENLNLYGSDNSMPESFDLRSTGLMSPVRNQTGFGTCWAHSAIASAESNIIKSKPDINLSEFHTAYYTYSGGDQIEPYSDDVAQTLSHGGTHMAVTNLWAQWIGPVLEKRIPYGNTEFFDNKDDVEIMKYNADYHLKNSYTFDYNSDRTNFDEINSLVKQFVYNGQPVDVSFYTNQGVNYNSTYFSTNSTKKSKYANHSVVIAGWDDNFPAENFNTKPENNGAWLVKNSWGEGFGDNGYIWISYEDTSLCEFAVYELEDKEKYTYNFHHDTFVAVQSLSAADDPEVNDGSYMANVFCNTDNVKQLNAVATYITQPNTEYEITVYTGLSDISNPVSGTPSAVTHGISEMTGYFTIELDDYVMLEQDEYFSVVVRLYSENAPYVIPLETCIAVRDHKTEDIISLGSFTTYEGIKKYTSENESFFSTDGKEWSDVTNEDYIYTDEEVEELLAELETDLFEDIAPDDTEGLENAANALEFYKEMFAAGDVMVVMGNISLKALANPYGTVDFSQDSGVVPDGTLIELSAPEGGDIYYYINDSDEKIRYTEPLEITELTDVYAEWIGENSERVFSLRTYIPESCFVGAGDFDGNGLIDSADASKVLEYYAAAATGYAPYNFINDYADYNQDNIIDALDASEILEKYAELSTK